MRPFIQLLSVILMGASLCACSSIPESTALTDGVAVAPPAGWVGFCQRHAEDSGCRR